MTKAGEAPPLSPCPARLGGSADVEELGHQERRPDAQREEVLQEHVGPVGEERGCTNVGVFLMVF